MMNKKVSNQMLQDMIAEALDNWDFGAYTDPQDAKETVRGLVKMSEMAFEQDVIDEHVSDSNDWDGLQEWARWMGEEIK